MKDFEGRGLLTAKEAAAYLRVSARSLRRIPVEVLPRVRYGYRTLRFDRGDLDAYIARCKKAA